MTGRMFFAVLVAFASCAVHAAAPTVRVIGGDAVANPRQPQVAVDETGIIHLAFGAAEGLYYTASIDGGQNYAAPIKVATLPKLALGMRRGPRIAAGHGAVVITAISHQSGDVQAWRSTDGGKTWDAPVQVNDSPGDAREGLHGMAMGPSGDLFCTWLDHRSGKTEIYGAGSTDGGQTWSDNRKIYSAPSGNVCECCHPSVAFDDQGAVYVMWRNSLAGARDMYFSLSRDGGETFTEAVKLGIGTWKLNACPMDGGSLAVASPGEATSIWRREKTIYRTSPGRRGEEQLGMGEQPWAAASDSGVWLIWVSRRGGDLLLLAPESRQPIQLANHAADPVIAAPAEGNGPVVAVWESGTGKDTAIMSSVLSEDDLSAEAIGR